MAIEEVDDTDGADNDNDDDDDDDDENEDGDVAILNLRMVTNAPPPGTCESSTTAKSKLFHDCLM